MVLAEVSLRVLKATGKFDRELAIFGDPQPPLDTKTGPGMYYTHQYTAYALKPGYVTGGGLVFIGATADNRFSAFSLEDGEELWSTKLPTGSFAHPMTYELGGKQYLVIVSGGHPFVDQDPGDWVTAFALPD